MFNYPSFSLQLIPAPQQIPGPQASYWHLHFWLGEASFSVVVVLTAVVVVFLFSVTSFLVVVTFVLLEVVVVFFEEPALQFSLIPHHSLFS